MPKRKKIKSAATKRASENLKGSQTTPKPEFVAQSTEHKPKQSRWPKWLSVRNALIFTGVGLVLDILLYFYFKHELDRCYGVLCLFE